MGRYSNSPSCWASNKKSRSWRPCPPTAAEVDLGIDVSPITEELAERFSLEQRTGILVVQVVQGGVANAEGLRKGDIIQEVNRAAVSHHEGIPAHPQKGSTPARRFFCESFESRKRFLWC